MHTRRGGKIDRCLSLAGTRTSAFWLRFQLAPKAPLRVPGSRRGTGGRICRLGSRAKQVPRRRAASAVQSKSSQVVGLAGPTYWLRGRAISRSRLVDADYVDVKGLSSG